MYEIVDYNRTCKKRPLKKDFQPLEIPGSASLLGQVILGSSSGPGQGLLVNTWTGDLPNKAGESECNVLHCSVFFHPCHSISTVIFISVPQESS